MLKKMMWIGLTGGIASGKSTVAKFFKARGVPVIDADLISRQVLGPGTPGLRSVIGVFGHEIVDAEGHLNRRELGKKVFGHPEMLLRLESIVHPLVQQEVAKQRQQAQESGAQLAIYDVPLLFEKRLESQFDGVITVHSTLENQKTRMKVRDQLSDREIEQRLASQLPLDQKKARSHWNLQNDGSLKELEAQVSHWLETQSAKT